jgi:hypothetical protein
MLSPIAALTRTEERCPNELRLRGAAVSAWGHLQWTAQVSRLLLLRLLEALQAAGPVGQQVWPPLQLSEHLPPSKLAQLSMAAAALMMLAAAAEAPIAIAVVAILRVTAATTTAHLGAMMTRRMKLRLMMLQEPAAGWEVAAWPARQPGGDHSHLDEGRQRQLRQTTQLQCTATHAPAAAVDLMPPPT